MKKKSKKKVTAILFLLVLLIALIPDVQSDPIGDKPSPDYGIYDAIEEVQDEKNDRINSPEILNETRGRFDDITVISGEERIDLTAGREIVSPDIPVPEMHDIFQAMNDWDQLNNTSIIDWILPPNTPLNYYIYTKYMTNDSVNQTWTNASLRPTLGINMGGINPNLDRWWDVDVDLDGTDDISVFFAPVPDTSFLTGMSIQDLRNFLLQLAQDRTITLAITLEYNIRKLNDAAFNTSNFKGLEVYVAKSLSYSSQNFILFTGLNFTNVVSEMNCTVRVDTVQLGGISFVESIPDIIAQIMSGQLPTLNISYGDIANLSGPYSLKWDSNNEPLLSMGLDVVTAKILINQSNQDDPYDFLNRSWVDVDFHRREPYSTVPKHAELWVEADDSLSSFDEIRWINVTPEYFCNVNLKFFDEQENVTYAEVEIDNLPPEIIIEMRVEDRGGQNITIIDYNAKGIVNYLTLRSYTYFDTGWEDITAWKILTREIEYSHLFLNVSHIPQELYLEGIFFLEEVEPAPDLTPGLGIVADFLESLTHRVISRFTRIAKTLSSVPTRLLTMSEDGTFAVINTYDQDEIEKLEFVFTSGDYVTTDGNFFAFYNNTRPSDYPIAQVSLSGRITKIRYVNASFEEDIFARVAMMNDEPFRAIYTDNINSLNAQLNISNVPGMITVFRTSDKLRYDGTESIDELRFISDYQGNYMDFKISDVSDHLNLEFGEDRSYISTLPPGNMVWEKIGDIEFLVTTGPILRQEGNHLLIRQESDYSLLSGRINDIARVEYLTGDEPRLDVEFIQENTLNISLFDNRTEKISADLIIEPMPSSLSINLSGLFSTDRELISLPQIDSGGVMGFASIIFGIAALGNEIMEVIDETTQNAISNVGNIIENLSFSYSTDNHVTLIGKVLRGERYSLDDVDWMHGISARQKVTSNETSMAAKLYLSGLPTDASIITKIKDDDIFLDFHLIDFSPIHDWLCIDVRGLRNRDAMLYLNNISSGMDLDLIINLTASLNTIPQRAAGSIHMDSDESIGTLYGRMRQTDPEITISEVFLDSVPRTLDCEFNLSGNISISFQAYTGIEYMFVKSTRSKDEELHDIYAILHEVPQELTLTVTPQSDYDMDGSLLQTLPTLDLSTSGGTLDAYIFADGKGMGQVGVVELQMVNTPETLSGRYSDDKYRITSTGVDYLWVHVMNLPIMENHETKSIELVGKDIKSFDISVDTLFGNYPVIGIDNTDGGEVQLVLDHEVDDSKIGLALIDFQIKGGLPQSPRILINGGSVDLDKDSSHVIIPAPMLTLVLSIFS